MSDCIAPRSQSRRFSPGDVPGQGIPCPSRRFARYGKGTAADPEIYWTIDTRGMDQDYIDAHNALAREKAKQYNMPCIIIRKDCHSTYAVRDRARGRFVFQNADPHMTVYMGADLHNCQIQGHIFLTQNEKGVLAVATPEQRILIRPGNDRCSDEMWVTEWYDASTQTRQRKGRYSPTRKSTVCVTKMTAMSRNWRDRGNQPPAGGCTDNISTGTLKRQNPNRSTRGNGIAIVPGYVQPIVEETLVKD